MTFQEIASADVVSFDDLKLLATEKNLCITVVTSIPDPIGIRTRFDSAIRQVETKLAARGTDRSTIASLVEALDSVITTIEAEKRWANALILFRSPDMFRYFWLRELPHEIAVVTDRFRVWPLLSALSREQRFYILALSQQHTRLFHCTAHSAERVSLRGVTAVNLHVWMQTRTPDHVLDNRSAAGPSAGSMKGVMFGTSADREREDEYLSHFFKQVDKGLQGILRSDTAALVLAGVEYEVALYRKISTHPRLLEKRFTAPQTV